jgi:ATP-dependent DNA helicase RecG
MGDPREQRPVTALRGVGAALAARLAVLGVEQVQDLLFVLPTRYEDRTRVQPIGSLLPGSRVVIEGEVLLTEVVFRRRRQMLCRLADGSGFLTLRFFHFSKSQQDGLARGARIRCFGEVRRGPLGLEIVHPEYRRVAEGPGVLEDRLTPVYPMTEGVTQGRLRMLIGLALRELDTAGVREWLPESILQPLGLPSLRTALEFVHRPPVDVALDELEAGRHPAQRRLAFEELLTHHVVMRRLRDTARTDSATPLHDTVALAARFKESLPYALTGAQQRSLNDIERDLQQVQPMVRLVQGDVGCGKTVVAAAAAARAIGSGCQVALMAPTELLAEQHQKNLDAWFRPLGITVGLVTGSQPARTRRGALEAIAAGDLPLVVGTHALFQDGVQFSKLALVIVDEQHRFGVQQRLRLAEKGLHENRHPHQLIMTATPIPRTLAMTAYADLDVSIIDELPPGRTPVKTVVAAQTRRDEVVARIAAACRVGRQAYWVCPLIDESEELQCQAAEETAVSLTEALPEFRVGLVHGRMKAKEKEAVMLEFKAGRIQLLVATTVIEVGVDVPNATVMVIENAERMGLAQLHQLRGRVGRGSHESSCVLLYRAPLGALARARLDAIRDSNDGFDIAQRDLELRGPGELLGTRQTGLARMRVADLARDVDLLPEVHRAAETLLAQHPDRIAPLTARWIGSDDKYGRIG